MLSVVLIAAVLVGLLFLIVVISSRRRVSRITRSTRVFATLSPLPLVLTVLVPVLINLATGFQGGRAIYVFSLAGCLVSFGLITVGIALFVRSWFTGHSEIVLLPATLLASIPALILVFIYLFGLGGIFRR